MRLAVACFPPPWHLEPDFVYCVMFSPFSSFSAPLDYYSDSDTQPEGRLESIDPQLTALLHERVVKIKEELNWDEKEKEYQEIRQKETLCYDDSDSDNEVVFVSITCFQ